MKKIIILCILCSVLYIGCSNIYQKDDLNFKDGIELPNGKVLSNTEVLYFKNLSEKYNYGTESSRKCSINEFDIQEMIDVLNEELGENARNYYGETIVSKEIISLQNPERALQINMADNEMRGWIETTVVEHWGVWWCYLVYESRIVWRNINSISERMLATDSAICYYEDSATEWFEKRYDWTYLDNPANKETDFYGEIEWEVANANRGLVKIQGDTKYGLFPSVSDLFCSVTFYDTAIRNGSVSFNTRM